MKIKLFIICTIFSVSCSLSQKLANSAATPAQNTANQTAQTNSGSETTNNSTVTTPKPESKFGAQNCPPVKREGKRQIKSQSFPFNFKPFPESCFVTFASVEEMMDEKDVPRGSTFHIYQNVHSVVDLPDAFDGQTGCWVEGVAFKDLNSDGLTDIIIAGACLGAKDSYPQNAIFVNTGKAFTTKGEANQKLENFRKLSEIEAYVKRNVNSFF